MPAASVRVRNATRGTLLGERVRLARDPWSRLVGLLGSSSLPEGEGMLLEPCDSVHTWFMRFPIDVAVLDRDDNVLHAVSGLLPWKLVWPREGARSVLELPAGTLARSGTLAGDRLAREERTEA